LPLYFSVFGTRLHQLPMAELMLVLALGAMFVASTVACFQNDFKRLFAYSSVAQIGYIVLGLSFDSVTGLTATIVHLANHAVTKGGVFLLLGAVVASMGGVTLARIQGVGRVMPLTSFGIVLCGLSLIGVPGTAGFVSKWYLVLAALEKGQWWLVFLIVLSSLLAVIYVWRFVEAAYFRAPRADLVDAREASPALLVPALLMVGATLYFGIDTSLTAERVAGGPALIGAPADAAGDADRNHARRPVGRGGADRRLPSVSRCARSGHARDLGTAFRLCRGAAAAGARRCTSWPASDRSPARPRAGVSHRATRNAVCAGRFRVVDREFAVFDRLHARQQ
jgi:formate hydrogenlyase subunit 3/multisubunit Na+/H+ antiporter MnhD subunit